MEDVQMKKVPAVLYTQLTHKQQMFIRLLDDKLQPLARCQQQPNTLLPTFAITPDTINQYINPIIFEMSDMFWIMIEELCQMVFNKDAVLILEFNNVESTFWFLTDL